MAAGDLLCVLTPLNAIPPSSNPATLDTFAGASNAVIPVLDFDPGATEESVDFSFVMPRHYGGGGLTLTIGWSSDATTGNVIWSAAFKAVTDDGDDLDTVDFAAQNDSAASATASAAGEVDYATITFTDGADMDSVAAGEFCFLRITRSSADASDTLDSNDAELHFVEVRETP